MITNVRNFTTLNRQAHHAASPLPTRARNIYPGDRLGHPRRPRFFPPRQRPSSIRVTRLWSGLRRTRVPTAGAAIAAKACTSRRLPASADCKWRHSSNPARRSRLRPASACKSLGRSPPRRRFDSGLSRSSGAMHYRMDVVRDRARTFEWPADVLVSLGLQPRDVGVVGWVERPLGGSVEQILRAPPPRQGRCARQDRSLRAEGGAGR